MFSKEKIISTPVFVFQKSAPHSQTGFSSLRETSVEIPHKRHLIPTEPETKSYHMVRDKNLSTRWNQLLRGGMGKRSWENQY